MRRLESRFAALAHADGDIYLPNFTPAGPVDALLIGIEPSLRSWAASEDEAHQKIEAGFRNFMNSPEDWILHFCVRRYLCGPGETYHVTDISKGAMRVDAANAGRRARFRRWYDLLVEEIDLVAKPTAKIVAIGQAVRRQLDGFHFARPFTTILHYSPQAIVARRAAVAGHEERFATFAKELSLDLIVDVAVEVLRANQVPGPMAAETVARLRRTVLNESRQQLALIYTVAFERLATGASPVR
jgi:hypothetical protein